jgi:hypothetical protein
MTSAQADALVGLVISAWPRFQWPEGTALLWRSEFQRLENYELALEVVQVAYRTPGSQFPPPIGDVLAAYDRRAERHRMETWRDRELPEEALPSREETLEHVGEAIRQLWPDEPDNGNDEKEAA